MIHISQVLILIEKHLKSIEPKEVIHFKTYKKDRGFLIYCLGDGEFQLIEHGFKNSKFSGDATKIKLRNSGYRLVYQVLDDVVVVFVISVGKRERSEAYKAAQKRLR